jgi:anti-anti-sigma regulatory factor
MARFRDDLLNFVQESKAIGVILDLSGVEVMDAHDFGSITQITDMVRVMGSQVMLAGLRPGVVSALVNLGVNTDRIQAAMNLDDAFERLDAVLGEHGEGALAQLRPDDAESEANSGETADELAPEDGGARI